MLIRMMCGVVYTHCMKWYKWSKFAVIQLMECVDILFSYGGTVSVFLLDMLELEKPDSGKGEGKNKWEKHSCWDLLLDAHTAAIQHESSSQTRKRSTH